MKLALLFLIVIAAVAQPYEIRGTVVEGPNTPIVGAEVKIFEVESGNEFTLLATVFSDTKGVYSHKVQRLGSYRMEIRKPGYVTSAGMSDVARATLHLTSAGRSESALSVTLVRPGSLTGRVVNEDRKPISGLRVYVQAGSGTLRPTGRDAFTDENGSFTVPNLIPQTYVVRIAPESMATVAVLDDSEDEFRQSSRDVEVSFSPSVPIPVQSGATTDVGMIAVRTVPYYRARIRYDDACSKNENWLLTLVKLPYGGRATENTLGVTNCQKEFLLDGLAPGSYLLAISVGNDSARWSVTPLVVITENIEASMRFSPNVNMTASLTIPTGVSKPDLAKITMNLEPENGLTMGRNVTFTSDEKGHFSMPKLSWPVQQMVIQGLPSTHYIKEIRVGGQLVSAAAIPTSPAGHIDIVLDDHPATIRGKVNGAVSNENILMGAFVLVAREGAPSNRIEGRVPVGAGSTYEIRGLAPGEYRIGARVGIGAIMPADAQRVRVSVGETKTMDLSVK